MMFQNFHKEKVRFFVDFNIEFCSDYPLPLTSAASCGKRIVGYYTGWEPRKISENQISKLTHIIFVAIRMYGNGQVQFHNSEYSSRFFELKRKARRVNSKIKVMIGVGGKGNTQHFSSVMADKEKRKTFISSLVKFVSSSQIDGLEITWTYPFAQAEDRQNLVIFLKELRAAFTKLEHENGRTEKYIIDMLTPQIIWKQSEGYDFRGILKYADFINVISYEYYGPWGQKTGAYTGPVGPLYGGMRGNIDDTMKSHACGSMKPTQVTLGIPLYGKFWRNVKEEVINQNETMCEEEICRIEDQGESELWKLAELKNGRPKGGFISWNDRENDDVGIIWDKKKAKWDNETKSSYIWNPEERLLITFESEKSIEEKVKYAIEKNLGGINIFSVSMDDELDTALSLVSSMKMCNGVSKNKIIYNC
uniref:Glyco_18 domain-containing protein n=1 Tax=Caenorhabditis tropicalis TaxID=1561998 RepID=A0A1I7UCF5_9PELO